MFKLHANAQHGMDSTQFVFGIIEDGVYFSYMFISRLNNDELSWID